MLNNNKRGSSYDAFNRKRVKYFSYAEEFYCNEDSQAGTKNVEKVQGLYLLIGGLLLIASLCLLGFDLFLQTPHDGVAPGNYDHVRAPQHRRHTNTPVSAASSTPPVLGPTEYWL